MQKTLKAGGILPVREGSSFIKQTQGGLLQYVYMHTDNSASAAWL